MKSLMLLISIVMLSGATCSFASVVIPIQNHHVNIVSSTTKDIENITNEDELLRQISKLENFSDAQELFFQLAGLSDEKLANIFIRTQLAGGTVYFEIQCKQRFNVIFAKYDEVRKTNIYTQVLEQIDEFKRQASSKISNDPLQTLLDVFKLPQIRTLLIGDVHFSVREDRFLISLIDKILGTESVDTIALEIPHSMQENVNRFLITADNSEAEKLLNEIKQANPLVIDTDSYIEILKHLRELSLRGIKLNILCFDVTLEEQRTRGQIYRENFMYSKIKGYLETNPEKKLLIFVGDEHTKESADASQEVEKRLGLLLDEYLKTRNEESFSVTVRAPIGYLLSIISDETFGIFTKDLPLRLYMRGNTLQETWDYILNL